MGGAGAVCLAGAVVLHPKTNSKGKKRAKQEQPRLSDVLALVIDHIRQWHGGECLVFARKVID